MEESLIVYNYNFEHLKDAMIEAYAKNGRSINSLRKYYYVPLSLLLSCIVSIFISYPFPNYSFLIVIFLVLFVGSLLYIPYSFYRNHKIKKDIRRIKKVFEQYKYYKVTFTEEDITIETDLEKNIQKWQQVNVVSLEGNLCSFTNGSTSYFFVERSMASDDVAQLKELVQKKSKLVSPDS